MDRLAETKRSQSETCAAKVVRRCDAIALSQPFWSYAALYESCDYAFLLDSGMDPDRLGQFSFIGGRPIAVFRAVRRDEGSERARANIEILRWAAADGTCLGKPKVSRPEGDVFAQLRELLREYATTNLRLDLAAGNGHAWPESELDELPVPFLSGAVGYFGYEAAHFIEDLPNTARNDLRLPDIYFAIYDSVLCHCHATGKSYLSVTGRGCDEVAADEDDIQ